MEMLRDVALEDDHRIEANGGDDLIRELQAMKNKYLSEMKELPSSDYEVSAMAQSMSQMNHESEADIWQRAGSPASPIKPGDTELTQEIKLIKAEKFQAVRDLISASTPAQTLNLSGPATPWKNDDFYSQTMNPNRHKTEGNQNLARVSTQSNVTNQNSYHEYSDAPLLQSPTNKVAPIHENVDRESLKTPDEQFSDLSFSEIQEMHSAESMEDNTSKIFTSKVLIISVMVIIIAFIVSSLCLCAYCKIGSSRIHFHPRIKHSYPDWDPYQST